VNRPGRPDPTETERDLPSRGRADYVGASQYGELGGLWE
jgi:hypothetical protein